MKSAVKELSLLLNLGEDQITSITLKIVQSMSRATAISSRKSYHYRADERTSASSDFLSCTLPTFALAKSSSDERENFLLICDDNKFLNEDGVKNAFYNFLNYENPMREKLREVKLKIEYVGDEEFNYEDSIVLIIKLLRNLYGIANFEKVRPMHNVEIIVDKNKIGGVVNIIKKENGLIRKILDDNEMGKIECIVPVNNNDLIDMIRKETGGLVVWNIIRMEYVKTII